MINGTLNIDLKGTEVVVDEPKGWFTKLFTKVVGKTEYEQESVTQLQYLQKIYTIFSGLGWKNIVSLDLNGETVYNDDEYTEDDFQEAMNLAYGKIEQKDFKVVIHLENIKNEDTADETEETVTVDFSSKHDVGEFPLVVEAELDKPSEEVKTFLEYVKTQINDAFGIVSGEINVDEDEEEEDSDDDEDDEDSEDETSETEESTEEKTTEEKVTI